MDLNSHGKLSPKKGAKKFVFEPPPNAPVFRPTAEEFKDPLKYIKKIRPIGEKTGICKIIPPPGWKTPFALNMDTLKFVPRIQRINELEARTRIKLNFNDKLTKFFALSGKTFQVPLMEKTALDLYTLHRQVKERGGVDVVNRDKKWGDIALAMGFTCKHSPSTLKSHYDDLIQPFLQSQAIHKDSDENKENYDVDSETGESFRNGSDKSAAMRELKSLKFLGPGPKMAVFDGGAMNKGLRTRGKKIMYEFDPLAKYMCKGCKKGDIEETYLVMCVHCEDRYHHSCLIPPLSQETPPDNWKCPKCVAAEGYKPLEEFGFAQAEREYTLNEFKFMANEFKKNYFNMDPDQVEHPTVEHEFWRVVSSIDEAVTVEYGADLHVIEHGSGFPRLDQPCVEGVDQKKFEKYAKSPWNLNNLPVLEESVLKHISADISGMKIPWMYAGMCFATFCWHNEDHWSYSINYLHLGEAKTWYGVPGCYAEQFEAAMQNAAPELFESQPDLLHQLVTIMNPNEIMAAGVPVYRTDQKRGEFVITFPRAYHAGFNQGFNFAEACNFAPADWLVIGRECIQHYSQLRRTCVFSHDELVCKMAIMFETLERDVGLVLIKDMSLMVQAERLRRTRTLRLGVGSAEQVEFDKLPDDERQCCVCNTTVFLSGVTCSCDSTRLVCLDHITNLCCCDPKNYVMKYQLKLDILQNLLVVISSKLCGFDKWTSRVQQALTLKDQNRVSLESLRLLFKEAKNKEFPEGELLELLEYHVRRCMECAALAKVLLANCMQKDIPKKITLEDIESFYQLIAKLPCSLPEETAIKNVLDKAKKFQKSAQKVLCMKEASKPRLLPCIKMGQSLNLVLPELEELEKKLVELEWAEQVDFALASKADADVIQKLWDVGKSFPDSSIVVKMRRDLENHMVNNSGISRLNLMSLDDFEPNESNRPSESDNLERTLQMVFSGELVLYLRDLEDLVVKVKKEMPNSSGAIKQLEQGVAIVRNWEMAAKSLFLKKGYGLSLMEAIWPRKFVSRHHLYAKHLKQRISGLESLIDRDDVEHFMKKNFKEALKKEFASLNKLRIENAKKFNSNDLGFIKCVCGKCLDNSAIVCELCYTVMHLSCFQRIDSTQDPKSPSVWDTNFRTRRLCGFCKRTNRPPLRSVVKLVETVDRLDLKIPECFAVKMLLSRVEKWRDSLKIIINPEALTARSQEILEFFRKFHGKRYGEHPLANDLLEESHLIIGTSRGISRMTLLNLKEELIQGNRFEITVKELDEIWNSLNPLWIHAEIESEAYNGFLCPIRGDSIGTPLPIKTINQPESPTKKVVKRKQPSGNSSGSANNRIFGKRRRCIKRTKAPPTSTNSTLSKKTEEHEPEANCAAPICLKPVDASLDWVMCDGACKQWFHMKCVDLDNKDVNEDDEYICTNCVCNRVCDQVTGSLVTAGTLGDES